MKTPEQRAKELIDSLDEERRTGYCDEYGLVAHAFRETDETWRDELKAQLAVRDDELNMLRQVLGLKNRKDVSPDEQQAIKDAVAAGLSMREAARRFGLKSPSTVHRIVRESSRSDEGL